MEPPNNERQYHGDNDNDSEMMDQPASNTMLALPPELRNAVLQNLGEMELAECAMVSRQCHDDSRAANLTQRRTAVINCSSRSSSDHGASMFGLGMHPLVGALLKIPTSSTSRIFQGRFTRIRVKGASCLLKINNREAKPILRSLSLPGVTHLDLSSSCTTSSSSSSIRQHTVPTATTSTTKAPHIAPSIVRLWTHILPRLADLDLSYNQVGTATLADIARNGHALETLRLVGGILVSSSVTLRDLAESESLRALYLEDCRVAATPKEEDDVFLDAEQPEACPFSHVLRNLERMSLKGCRYYDIKKEKEDAMLLEEDTTATTTTTTTTTTMPYY